MGFASDTGLGSFNSCTSGYAGVCGLSCLSGVVTVERSVSYDCDVRNFEVAIELCGWKSFAPVEVFVNIRNFLGVRGRSDCCCCCCCCCKCLFLAAVRMHLTSSLISAGVSIRTLFVLWFILTNWKENNILNYIYLISKLKYITFLNRWKEILNLLKCS